MSDEITESFVWLETQCDELRAEVEALKDGSERAALKGIEMRREIDALRADVERLREQLRASDKAHDDLIRRVQWDTGL